MGLSTCISLIQLNTTCEIDENRIDITGIKLQNLTSLNPKNLNISIVKPNRVIVVWEGLLTSNDDSKDMDEELSNFEIDVSFHFPKCEIITFFIQTNVDFVYFSYISNNQIRRRKCVAQGELRIDTGNLLKFENLIAERVIESYKKSERDIIGEIGKHFPKYSEDEKRKHLLRLYSKHPDTFNYNYFSGTLDTDICENFFDVFTKMDFYEFEEKFRFVQFKVKKINYSEDSISSYIYKAILLSKQYDFQ